jgi:hypothetical protein
MPELEGCNVGSGSGSEALAHDHFRTYCDRFRIAPISVQTDIFTPAPGNRHPPSPHHANLSLASAGRLGFDLTS